MIIEKDKKWKNPTPKGWHIHSRFLIGLGFRKRLLKKLNFVFKKLSAIRASFANFAVKNKNTIKTIPLFSGN
jgi:hypothetical protein